MPRWLYTAAALGLLIGVGAPAAGQGDGPALKADAAKLAGGWEAPPFKAGKGVAVPKFRLDLDPPKGDDAGGRGRLTVTLQEPLPGGGSAQTNTTMGATYTLARDGKAQVLNLRLDGSKESRLTYAVQGDKLKLTGRVFVGSPQTVDLKDVTLKRAKK